MSDTFRLGQEEEHPMAGWLGDDVPAPAGEPEPLLAALDALWAGGPPEGALEAMRKALDAWWAGERWVVYYDSLSAPIGEVYAAISNKGVISVDFGYPDEGAYLEHLRERHLSKREVRAVRSPERLAEVMRQLSEYFRGERDRFDFPLDLRGLTDFQRQVLEATSRVRSGQIVTYKEIARRIGRPTAIRAVGNALGRNPVPIVIPCHRVVPQDGSLGGYSGAGGTGTKARLLELEGVLPGKGGLYAPS